MSVSDEGCEKVSFYIGWRIRQNNLEYRRGSKSHRWEDSWSDGTERRSDPRKRDIRAGAEEAEYRSGSHTKKGERLLLGT